jgi:hypothetical protein
MRKTFTFLLLLGSIYASIAQKSLILERANRAKVTHFYVGDNLRFRLAGAENYWYDRTITDILPETNTLLLDNFAVKLDSIVAIRVPRQAIWRYLGGTLFTFGASLAFANTIAILYHDKNTNFARLYEVSAASMVIGYIPTRRRTLHLGNKHRLRIIEIKFPDPLIPPPPPNFKH